MFPFVWDYMAQKIDIREGVYDWLIIKKEQEKTQYDRRVKTQYFSPSNLMLLKDSTPHLGKLTEEWCGPFIISSFGGDHSASYVLKTLDGEPASNMHYDDHLCIFHPRKRYLRPADEELLKILCNLRFRRKKN